MIQYPYFTLQSAIIALVYLVNSVFLLLYVQILFYYFTGGIYKIFVSWEQISNADRLSLLIEFIK